MRRATPHVDQLGTLVELALVRAAALAVYGAAASSTATRAATEQPARSRRRASYPRMRWRRRQRRATRGAREPGRAAPRAARPAGRLPVPRRRGPRDLRRQGEVGAQARRLALLQGAGAEQPGARRDGRQRGAASSAWSSPPRPRRCWPSRASSSSTGRASTSACATTSPIRSSRSRSTRTIPRVYFTRERHRARRAYFGPYSNAKRVRGTLEVLGEGVHVPLVHRPGAGPAQRQPVPGLLHQALRGALRRLRLQARSTARASTA